MSHLDSTVSSQEYFILSFSVLLTFGAPVPSSCIQEKYGLCGMSQVQDYKCNSKAGASFIWREAEKDGTEKVGEA